MSGKGYFCLKFVVFLRFFFWFEKVREWKRIFLFEICSFFRKCMRRLGFVWFLFFKNVFEKIF